MKNQYKTKADVIRAKYGQIVVGFDGCNDDRQVAYNLYQMMLKACEAMEDMENNYVKTAVNQRLRKDSETLDGIIYRCIGKTFDNASYSWR